MTGEMPLIVERRDNVAILTLNRPAKRNALNDATVDALDDFFSAIPQGIGAVVLRGVGEHFCAGLDLAEVIEKNRTPAEIIRHSRGWHRTFDLIQFGDVPVICCIQGGAIGGGLELAAATHIRVCESTAFFQLPEGQRGIFLGGGGSVRAPRIIGTGRVVEMMLTGRRIEVDEGLRLGLAHYSTTSGGGLDKALEIAAVVAGNLPTSNYAIINGIARIAEMGPAEELFSETMTAIVSGAAAGSRGRIKDFLDRKRPTEQPAESQAAR